MSYLFPPFGESSYFSCLELIVFNCSCITASGRYHPFLMNSSYSHMGEM
nr:MAG TPA: hypothetical protein [Caudoviricetes sp.]